MAEPISQYNWFNSRVTLVAARSWAARTRDFNSANNGP